MEEVSIRKKFLTSANLDQQHQQQKLSRFLVGQTPVVMLTNSNALAYYNPAANNTELIIGASPNGLGAILAQDKTDGQYKPVQYASRS